MGMTLICAGALVADANQLLRVFGHGPADGGTFGPPTHTDPAGNRFALAGGTLAPVTAADLSGPLALPPWGADLAGAARAQAALVLWQPLGAGEAALPALGPDMILVVTALSPADVLARLGLVPLPPDPAL